MKTGPAHPLRILHLNSLLKGGGTDDHCVKLVHGLSQLGEEVLLAGPEGREFSRVARELGAAFHPTPPEGPLKLAFILGAAKLIRRQRFQIVHGHHGRDLWPTILAARLSGVRPKVVLTRHLAKSPSSWFSRRFLLSQCDAFVAVSHFVAKVLREGVFEPKSPEPERHARPPLMGDISKIRVIHGGIDTGRFRPFDAAAQRAEWGLAPGEFAFALVGSYDRPRGKGQREFLEAAARIHQRLPLARFLIVGRGNMAEQLGADIKRLGLEGKARLTPYCRDMPAAMNALDCLVHCQIGTEAFGLVLLEAFACGKPVIASALDGIPEAFAVADYGCLVPPEVIGPLAEAMLSRATEPPLDLSRRVQIHARVEREFSLLASARRVRELYEALMKAEPTAAP
jgi:glycosyltransferase involved in cell wall biosynthesis